MMYRKERARLEAWIALKDKERLSIKDLLSVQTRYFWALLALEVILAVAVLHYFGANSLPFGVVIGGAAASTGLLIRLKRNLPVDLKYINWERGNEALNEQTS